MSRDDDLVTVVASLQAEVRAMKLERVASAGLPPGTPVPWTAKRLPAGGFLWADGVAQARASYPELYETIMPSLGTCTLSLASPCEVTFAADHGLRIGDPVELSTTGALPTGVTAGTLYYVKTVPTTKKVTLGTSRSVTAVSGTVNTSGSTSGVHSARHAPWGNGNGTTTFNVPKYNGVTLVGVDVYGAGDGGRLGWLDCLGLVGGEQDHALSSDENGTHTHTQASHSHTVAAHNHSGSTATQPAHSHTQRATSTHIASGGGSDLLGMTFSGGNNNYTTQQTTLTATPAITVNVASQSPATDSKTPVIADSGSGTPHNTMQPSVLVAWIVKT